MGIPLCCFPEAYPDGYQTILTIIDIRHGQQGTGVLILKSMVGRLGWMHPL
jgi:hypothetical protein